MEATNPLLNLSVSDLKKAAELKERIDALNSELADLLGGRESSSGPTASAKGRKAGRRQMSEEGRRRIAEAAKARWARVNAAKNGGAKESASNMAPKKRVMSAAAKKKIAAAARARWAKLRAAKAGA